jgi:heme-degrading monooxygenase HmoA
MHVRIVRAQAQPGQTDEFVRRWKEHVAPRVSAAPGFRHVYLSGDRATGQVVGVGLWDAKPGEAADQAVREFGQKVQDIMAGPPAVEDYEVLAEA